jgi:hypothetical protein
MPLFQQSLSKSIFYYTLNVIAKQEDCVTLVLDCVAICEWIVCLFVKYNFGLNYTQAVVFQHYKLSTRPATVNWLNSLYIDKVLTRQVRYEADSILKNLLLEPVHFISETFGRAHNVDGGKVKMLRRRPDQGCNVVVVKLSAAAAADTKCVQKQQKQHHVSSKFQNVPELMNSVKTLPRYLVCLKS